MKWSNFRMRTTWYNEFETPNGQIMTLEYKDMIRPMITPTRISHLVSCDIKTYLS